MTSRNTTVRHLTRSVRTTLKREVRKSPALGNTTAALPHAECEDYQLVQFHYVR